jgi:glycosyltransferase involved in cell wall biosynthesis
MKPLITIGVTARNEAACIRRTLESLLHSVAQAVREGLADYHVVAILDECTDGTERVVREFPNVHVAHSSGGLIEAQRTISTKRPFVIFCDADILVGANVITALSRAMLSDPKLQVTYPRKRPLRPMRRTLLAAALYCYNRVEGFQTSRRYFNGKLFAIRDWQAPTIEQLQPRLAGLTDDRFYNYHSGLRVDDIWLSRDILLRHGAQAIREVEAAEISYQPPETLTGMYRMYLRMRREIERLNVLFPESVPAHQARQHDREAERRAPVTDRLLLRVFNLALVWCKIRYRMDRFYYQNLSSETMDAWKPVSETKIAP